MDQVEEVIAPKLAKANATISDVARMSGVSIATVSNVLNNGTKPVRETTRQRVLDAAKLLSYHPNATARSLVNRKTRTIGIFFWVIDSLVFVTNGYASGILQGVLTATTELDYNLMFFTRPRIGSKQAAFSAFQDGRADGLIIVAPPTNSDILTDLTDIGLNLSVIGAPAGGLGIPSVDVDDYTGGKLATEYLLSLGHRHIAHITGDADMSSVPLRRNAFADAMHRAGAELREDWIVASHYNANTAYDQTIALLKQNERPTAIFAGNDSIAMAALHAARDLHISVPGQLSIVGYDDDIASKHVAPPLTTIKQPLEEIGATATRLLVETIENGVSDSPLDQQLFSPELIVRRSTAAPALTL